MPAEVRIYECEVKRLFERAWDQGMAVGGEAGERRHFRWRDRVPLQGLSWSSEVAWEECSARTGAACGT